MKRRSVTEPAEGTQLPFHKCAFPVSLSVGVGMLRCVKSPGGPVVPLGVREECLWKRRASVSQAGYVNSLTPTSAVLCASAFVSLSVSVGFAEMHQSTERASFAPPFLAQDALSLTY